jgi:hemin uptake protein HemP
MKSPDEAAPPSQPADLSTEHQPAATAPAAAPSAQDGGPILSESLLRGRNEVQILHRGELYRLCLTRAGKLILHK